MPASTSARTTLRRRWAFRGACAALIAAAALLRLEGLEGDGFWHDEMWLRRIVDQPSWGAVLEAARADDARPVPAPLYLALLHGTVRLLGNGPFAMRLLPWASMTLGLLGTCWLGRKLLGRGTALVATALMALSPFFFYYAEETKQYSTDLAVALVVIASAERLMLSGSSRRDRWLFGLVCLLAALTSYSMLFVFPALVVVGWSRADRALRRDLVAWPVLGGLLGVLLYFSVARPKIEPVLLEFWRPFFVPREGLGAALEWHGRMLVGLTGGYLDWTFGHLIGVQQIVLAAVAVGLGGLGVWQLGRRGPGRLLLYLVIPLVLIEIAGVLRLYPLAGRLLLFWAPLALLVLAHGLVTVVRILPGGRAVRAVATSAVALAVLASGSWLLDNPLGTTARGFTRGNQRMRQVREREPDAAIYLHQSMIPQLLWAWWLPGESRGQRRGASYFTRGEYAAHLARLTGDCPADRIWLIHAHPFRAQDADLPALFGPTWQVTETYAEPGCEVKLLERVE